MLPSTGVSSPSRTRFASGSSVSAASTSSAVTSMPERSVRWAAISPACSLLIDGNADVTPAAAAPAYFAHAPKTMRSDASRGAMPTPLAFSAAAAGSRASSL